MAVSAKEVASSGTPWGAIGSVVGSIGGSLYSASQARKEAQRNRDFQERMSNTSHQRNVKDLRAAGLNPILSATKGMGSSTPSGSMAQQPDIGAASAKGVAAAAQLQLVRAQARNLNAQAHNSELIAPMNAATGELYETGGSALTAAKYGIGIAGGAASALAARHYLSKRGRVYASQNVQQVKEERNRPYSKGYVRREMKRDMKKQADVNDRKHGIGKYSKSKSRGGGGVTLPGKNHRSKKFKRF